MHLTHSLGQVKDKQRQLETRKMGQPYNSVTAQFTNRTFQLQINQEMPENNKNSYTDNILWHCIQQQVYWKMQLQLHDNPNCRVVLNLV